MPSVGRQYRTYTFGQKSINLGRCVKHQFIRRFSSLTSQISHQKKSRGHIQNFNTSALSDFSSSEKPVFRPRYPVLQDIPPAPPFPSTFNEQISTETIKSTDFSKAIQNHNHSITPSGTDISQSMSLRPNRLTELNSLRNRRRTPLTPDVLALTKIRRPEHIKSSIAQRIEELKQAASVNPSNFNEKNPNDLLITCGYKNTETERNWFKEQTPINSPVQILNPNNYLELNNRLFLIRSIEFLDKSNVRIHAQITNEYFLSKYFKPISLLTILIVSILRLIENTLSNLSIPGIQILLNLIYIFILITIAFILLINQK